MNLSSRFTPCGYQQIAAFSTAQKLTVPAGAVCAVLSCATQAIRWRDDGTAPTASIGMPLATGTMLEYAGNLGAFQAIPQTSSATLDVVYYSLAG